MNKTTSMNDQKLKNLRRKLFFLAGYLIVAGVLFAYVSYSQYRLTVKGAVMMPQTYTMNASLGITNTTGAAASLSSTTAAAVDIEGFLDAIRPGDNADTLAAVTDSTKSHYFNITINNWEIVSGQAVTSPLDFKYELYAETDGLLPLDFLLTDETGETQLASAKTDRTLQSYSALFTSAGAVFTDKLEGSASGTAIAANQLSKTYRVYVGWNNEANATTTQSIALSKELDKIRIKAVITALEAPSTSYESTTGPAVDQEHTYTTTDQAIQNRLNKE